MAELGITDQDVTTSAESVSELYIMPLTLGSDGRKFVEINVRDREGGEYVMFYASRDRVRQMIKTLKRIDKNWDTK